MCQSKVFSKPLFFSRKLRINENDENGKEYTDRRTLISKSHQPTCKATTSILTLTTVGVFWPLKSSILTRKTKSWKRLKEILIYQVVQSTLTTVDGQCRRFQCVTRSWRTAWWHDYFFCGFFFGDRREVTTINSMFFRKKKWMIKEMK